MSWSCFSWTRMTTVNTSVWGASWTRKRNQRNARNEDGRRKQLRTTSKSTSAILALTRCIPRIISQWTHPTLNISECLKAHSQIILLLPPTVVRKSSRWSLRLAIHSIMYAPLAFRKTKAMATIMEERQKRRQRADKDEAQTKQKSTGRNLTESLNITWKQQPTKFEATQSNPLWLAQLYRL